MLAGTSPEILFASTTGRQTQLLEQTVLFDVTGFEPGRVHYLSKEFKGLCCSGSKIILQSPTASHFADMDNRLSRSD